MKNDINLHNIVTVYRKEVFINRGWVAKAATSWNRPEGNTTLTAILSEPEPVCFSLFFVLFPSKIISLLLGGYIFSGQRCKKQKATLVRKSSASSRIRH